MKEMNIYSGKFQKGSIMVLILDGNSEHGGHVRKRNQICDCPKSEQMH